MRQRSTTDLVWLIERDITVQKQNVRSAHLRIERKSTVPTENRACGPPTHQSIGNPIGRREPLPLAEGECPDRAYSYYIAQIVSERAVVETIVPWIG